MKIRAAISPCPNDVFIFSGLLSGATHRPGDPEFAFAFHDLETLNRDVQAGRWDMAKISYANFPFCAGNYRLLRCGGALGRGCGPLLLSNRDGWDPGAEVLVPGKFTTANFLLDFYRHGQAGSSPLRKVFLPFDELYRRLLGAEPCQGVVIHEMRFTYASDGLHLVRDLGEYWEGATGFPIPLGAVALNRSLDGGNTELPQIVESLIRRSLDWAYAHPEPALDLCRRYSQSLSEAVLQSHIDLYVNAFSRDIGADGEAAVAFFLDRLRLFQADKQAGG